MRNTREQVKRLASEKKHQELALLVVSNIVWIWMVATQLPMILMALCLSVAGLVLAKKLNPGGVAERVTRYAKARGTELLVKMEEA